MPAILFFCNGLFSQTLPKDSAISSIINELTVIWNRNNNETFERLLDNSLKKPTNVKVKALTSISSNRTELLVRKNILQQRIYSRDYGFNVTAAYQWNASTPFADPEDLVIFRQKAQLGLEWDLLRGGLYDNQLKARSLRNEMDLLKNSSSAQNNARPSLLTSQQVVANFNRKKIAVIEKRKDLNAEQLKQIEKLWAYKHISKDAYLKALQNKADINGQFELYKAFSDKAGQIFVKPNDSLETPLLDIDFEKLLAKTNYAGNSSDTSYPVQLIENAKSESKFLREIGLRAYARYNYYDVYNLTIPNRTFVSFGLNLSVPLAFASKAKQELYLVNKQLELQQRQDNAEPGIEHLLLNYYYEYRYKLKKYFNLSEKRNVYGELLRTEKVKQEYSDLEFNPNTALFILDDYWSNTLELLDLHQDMYKLLINIKEKVPAAEISDFTFPVTLTNDIKDSVFAPPPVIAIYIWSKSLTSSDSKPLAEYTALNNFNRLIISYKNDRTYLSNLNAFIQKNYTTNIYLMSGNNKLINGGIQAYLDSMATSVSLNFVKGIHLDIEPHTFEDFKDKKEEYFAKYLQVLEATSAFCKKKNLKLEVSIPLHYPEEVLTKIFELCDKVYLMAYENISVDHIVKKTEEEIRIGKDKVILALRTKDFENRSQMDEHFKKLGFKNIAYHDFEGLLELDKKAIHVKETEK